MREATSLTDTGHRLPHHTLQSRTMQGHDKHDHKWYTAATLQLLSIAASPQLDTDLAG